MAIDTRMTPVAPSIQALRAEPTRPPAEPQSGRDELNLAEFPLAALSSRVSPRLKTLVFQDRIRDQSTGEFVARRLTVTASDKYGLPTALDDDVIVGLVQLTKASNDFTDRTVRFSRYALVRLLGWPDSGQSYRRVEESLKRWLGVTLSYEKAWWDKGSKRWVDEHFHLIDNVTLVHLEARRKQGVFAHQGELPLSSFSWNSVVFKSFQAENLKRLDLNLYFRLTHAPAKRAFRFLDKRFYRRGRLEFDLRDFACEHVGFSRNYDIGKLKEKLQPSIEELERADVLEPLSRAERYVQARPGCT
jgi:plasmid replication initiation protein